MLVRVAAVLFGFIASSAVLAYLAVTASSTTVMLLSLLLLAVGGVFFVMLVWWVGVGLRAVRRRGRE